MRQTAQVCLLARDRAAGVVVVVGMPYYALSSWMRDLTGQHTQESFKVTPFLTGTVLRSG